MATQALLLTNVGGDPCTIGTLPMVGFSDVGQGSFAPAKTAKTSVTLSPGESATLMLGAPATCETTDQDRAAVEPALSLTLSVGPPVLIPNVYVPTHCGDPQILRFEGQARDIVTSAMSDLAGEILSPGAAIPGEPMSYRVRLINPSPHSIELAPCPSYTEYLDGVPATYLLNCTVVSRLRPDESVVFDMHIAAPAALNPAGEHRLGWHLEVPAGLSAAVSLAASPEMRRHVN
jgi:hypothetical protein